AAAEQSSQTARADSQSGRPGRICRIPRLPAPLVAVAWLQRRRQSRGHADKFDQTSLGLGVRWHEHLEADPGTGSQPGVGYLEVENADARVTECPCSGVLDLGDCVAAPKFGELWRGGLQPGDE